MSAVGQLEMTGDVCGDASQVEAGAVGAGPLVVPGSRQPEHRVRQLQQRSGNRSVDCCTDLADVSVVAQDVGQFPAGDLRQAVAAQRPDLGSAGVAVEEPETIDVKILLNCESFFIASLFTYFDIQIHFCWCCSIFTRPTCPHPWLPGTAP